MNDHTADCIKCMELITEHRQRSRGYYPLPSSVECIRYAVQELGELDDAWMREDNPDHKRNNGREHDWKHELGQVGYMLGSAIVGKFQMDDMVDTRIPHTRTAIWATVAYRAAAGLSWGEGAFFATMTIDAFCAWVWLCYYLGVEPTHVLMDVCQKIDAKWGEHERQLL